MSTMEAGMDMEYVDAPSTGFVTPLHLSIFHCKSGVCVLKFLVMMLIFCLPLPCSLLQEAVPSDLRSPVSPSSALWLLQESCWCKHGKKIGGEWHKHEWSLFSSLWLSLQCFQPMTSVCIISPFASFMLRDGDSLQMILNLLCHHICHWMS